MNLTFFIILFVVFGWTSAEISTHRHTSQKKTTTTVQTTKRRSNVCGKFEAQSNLIFTKIINGYKSTTSWPWLAWVIRVSRIDNRVYFHGSAVLVSQNVFLTTTQNFDQNYAYYVSLNNQIDFSTFSEDSLRDAYVITYSYANGPILLLVSNRYINLMSRVKMICLDSYYERQIFEREAVVAGWFGNLLFYSWH